VFESQLCSINSTLLQHMHRTIHDTEHLTLEAKIDEVSQTIAEQLLLTRSSCQELKGSMKSWTAEAREAIHSNSHAQTIRLSNFLEENNSRSAERDLQFLHLCNDHATKMEALQAKILSECSPSKEAIQLAIDGLEKKVAANFLRHTKEIVDLLRQNELSFAALPDSLKGVAQLSSDNNTIAGLDARQLRCNLEEKQRTVARLNQRIRGFEQEAKATDAMRKRWRDDIKSIDVLRTQLAVAYQRMPRVECIAAKLEKIFSSNDSISATTKFLSSEANWILGELEARGPRPSIIAPVPSTSPPDAGQVDETVITPYQPQSSRVLGDFQFQKRPHNLINRKVTVRSPAWDIHSPSPPLSIEQEQLRRRGGSKPRSILRPTMTLDKNQAIVTENMSSGAMNHSQYKQPVAPLTNEPPKSAASESIMEGIRAGLLNLASNRNSDWAFTTVAEFENSTRMNHVSASCVAESWPGLDSETMARKRIKIDSSEDEFCNKANNINEDNHIIEGLCDNKPCGDVGVETTTGHPIRPASRPTHHSTM
jgi:hypothetical protein